MAMILATIHLRIHCDGHGPRTLVIDRSAPNIESNRALDPYEAVSSIERSESLRQKDEIVSVNGRTACYRCVSAEDVAKRGPCESCQSFTDHATGFIVDLHGITPDEVTLHFDNTGGQEGAAAVDEGCDSTIVDREHTERREAECDPEASRTQTRFPGFNPRSDIGAGNGLSKSIRLDRRDDDRRDSREGGHSRCSYLGRDSARPEGPNAPASVQIVENLVAVSYSVKKLRFGDEPGIVGVEAGSIGEDDKETSPHKVRYDRGEPIVVAESQLIDDDSVVLVDDGNDAKAE